ncbi:MAG TPA: glycosyltransferase family 25 protein [Methylibium sp.]|uniref:glycosyltransferase family 25 protein n=1 Tax=Methylibium sp. TaxID=2067992 RepID=UPI002DBB21CE|nr:glycosyltransferase family 25 protein [Methylibium sp.]HEU4459265.1 glycosyltransferase family 25 protein [Methylibium sp.]
MATPHPLEQFDRIFVINLAHRTDRRREMDEQLRRIGLSLEWPRITVFDAVRPDGPGNFPTLGARGCFMSHLGVLREAQRLGLKRVLVWEDDLDFTDDFVQVLESMRGEFDAQPWSMFYGTYLAPEGAPAPSGLVIRAEPTTRLVNTQFMAFQGDAIAAAADHLTLMMNRAPGHPEGGPMHVDGALNWFRRAHPERLVLLAAEQMGYERPSRTDVHELAWYDRVPLVRDVVDGLRKLKPSRVA